MEFTHSIKQPCERCDIKLWWQFPALSFWTFLTLYRKMWTIVHASCWNHSLKSPHYFSLLDERGETKIYISFQFIFENFDWGGKVYHFMELIRGMRELTQISCFSFTCLMRHIVLYIFSFYLSCSLAADVKLIWKAR